MIFDTKIPGQELTSASNRCATLGKSLLIRRPLLSEPGEAERGSSVLELLTVCLIFGILIAGAVSNMGELRHPLRDGSQAMLGFFKQARAKAVATTSAYTVRPAAGGAEAVVGLNCDDDAPVRDHRLVLELPSQVSFQSTTWAVCFDPRGLASTSETVILQGPDGDVRTIEVFLGGAVRVRS